MLYCILSLYNLFLNYHYSSFYKCFCTHLISNINDFIFYYILLLDYIFFLSFLLLILGNSCLVSCVWVIFTLLFIYAFTNIFSNNMRKQISIEIKQNVNVLHGDLLQLK